MTDYKVWGIPGSPFVRKLLVVLEEKGLPYTYKFVNIFPTPDGFEKINPMKRVPVLEIGEGEYLADTTAICLFLEREHPEPSLYPRDNRELAKAMMWEEYADTELALCFGMRLFRPLVVAQLMGKTPDLERVKKTLRELPAIYDTLSSRLDGREYFSGDTFGIVDISIATQFVNLKYAGFSPSPEHYPELAGFLERVLGRESFVGLLKREKLPPPIAVDE